MASQQQLDLKEGRFWKRDSFLWLPFDSRYNYSSATAPLVDWGDHLIKSSVRSYYFTSVQGDEKKRQEVEEALWWLGFTPLVFPRDKKRGSKGVDIALTKEMLSHAFRDNYDTAALVTADGDFIPLVEEVKRLGKRVHLWFFDASCVNPKLKLSVDRFADLSNRFKDQWERMGG